MKYNCDQCDKEFNQLKSKKLHVKSVHEQKKFPCQLCDHQAKQKSHLTAHKKSVHDGVRYACSICGYRTTRQSSLTRHILSKHKDEGKKYQCHSCEKEFTSAQGLLFHTKSLIVIFIVIIIN